MITKQELKTELILFLEEKINDINYLLDEETSPLLESMNNPDDEDYDYSNSEFTNLTNNANNLKELIDKLINNIELY